MASNILSNDCRARREQRKKSSATSERNGGPHMLDNRLSKEIELVAFKMERSTVSVDSLYFKVVDSPCAIALDSLGLIMLVGLSLQTSLCFVASAKLK